MEMKKYVFEVKIKNPSKIQILEGLRTKYIISINFLHHR